MHYGRYSISSSDKVAAVAIASGALVIGGALVVVGLVLLAGLVAAGLLVGSAATVYRRLRTTASTDPTALSRSRTLDPALEVFPPEERG